MVLPYGALVGFCVALSDQSTRTDVATVLLYVPGAQTERKCADWSATLAWAQVIPDNEGTVTSGLPDDSSTVTVEPSFCETFGAGLCNTTSPAATVIDVTGAPSFRFIWTLATAALACANGRFTTDGVGCEAVNTFVAKAVTRPAARMTANRTAAPIHHHFRLFGGRYGSEGPPVLSGGCVSSSCGEPASPIARPKARHRRARPGPPSSRSECQREAPARSPSRRPRDSGDHTRRPASDPSRSTPTPGSTEGVDGAESSSLGMINGRATARARQRPAHPAGPPGPQHRGGRPRRARQPGPARRPRARTARCAAGAAR